MAHTMTPITSTSAIPSWVVNLTMQQYTGSFGAGSGVLIASNFILTAAHNFYAANGNAVQDVSTIFIKPQLLSSSTTSPYRQVLSSTFDDLNNSYNPSGTTSISNSDHADDFALLQFNPNSSMNSAINSGAMAPAPLIVFQDASDAVSMVSSVTVFGYPSPPIAGQPRQLHFDTGDVHSVINTPDGPVYHFTSSIDTETGVSGGGYVFNVYMPGVSSTISGIGSIHSGEPGFAVGGAITTDVFGNIASSLGAAGVTANQMGQAHIILDQSGGNSQYNGTFVNETIYADAGADTINGNGGDDHYYLMNQSNYSYLGGIQQDDTVIDFDGLNKVVYSSSNVNGFGINAFTIEAMNYGLGYEISYSYTYHNGFFNLPGYGLISDWRTDTKTDTLLGVEQIEVDGVTYSLASLAPPPTINPFDPFRSLKSSQDNTISSDEYGMDNFMEPSMFDQPDTFDFYEFA